MAAPEMGRTEQQALLNALKLELQFCERGGYKTLVGNYPPRASENDSLSSFLFDEKQREMRRERSMFVDSPWCLNHRLPIKEHPCSECWLMNFVPPEKQNEAVPCHHIVLNDRGDTVATLGGPADAPLVQQTVREWLRAKIQEIESSLAAPAHLSSHL